MRVLVVVEKRLEAEVVELISQYLHSSAIVCVACIDVEHHLKEEHFSIAVIATSYDPSINDIRWAQPHCHILRIGPQARMKDVSSDAYGDSIITDSYTASWQENFSICFSYWKEVCEFDDATRECFMVEGAVSMALKHVTRHLPTGQTRVEPIVVMQAGFPTKEYLFDLEYVPSMRSLLKRMEDMAINPQPS